MKTTRTANIIIAFLITFCICYTKGYPCGGIFESDAGEFDLPPNDNSDVDLECVWIIQLLTRRTVNFTLTQLDSTSATVSLYPEHEASENLLNPIRLSTSDIGQTTQTKGQTLIVILTRSDYSAVSLSFTWDSASSATSSVLTAVSYVDSGVGRVLWNRFNPQERLTWALNLPSQNSLALQAEIHFDSCDLPNPCWCSYFSIYEVRSPGYLQEVTRICGRSLAFQAEQLNPKLVAFVYINSTVSVAGSNHVELTWAAQELATKDPGQPSEATTTTETQGRS